MLSDLLLDRRRDVVVHHALHHFDLRSLPFPQGIQIERRSGGNWLGAAGVPQSTSDDDEPCISHVWDAGAGQWINKGVLVRGQQEAMLREPGGVTHWTQDVAGGVTVALSSVTTNGLAHPRLTFSGTASGTSTRRLFIEEFDAVAGTGYLDDFAAGDLVTTVVHARLASGDITKLTTFGVQVREYWHDGVDLQIDTSGTVQIAVDTADQPQKVAPTKKIQKVTRPADKFRFLLPVIAFTTPAGTDLAGLVIDLHVGVFKGGAARVADDTIWPGVAGDLRVEETLVASVPPGVYDMLVRDHRSSVIRRVSVSDRLEIEPPNLGDSVLEVSLYQPGALGPARKRALAPDDLPAPYWTIEPTAENTVLDENDGVISIDLGGGLSAAQSEADERPTLVEVEGATFLDFVSGTSLDLTGVDLPDDRTVGFAFRSPNLLTNQYGSTLRNCILGCESIPDRQQFLFGGTVPSEESTRANLSTAMYVAHGESALDPSAHMISGASVLVEDFDVWTVVLHTRTQNGTAQVFDILQPFRAPRLNTRCQGEQFVTYGTTPVSTIGRRHDPEAPGTGTAAIGWLVGQLARGRCYAPPLDEAQRARLASEMLMGLPLTSVLRVAFLWAGGVTDTGFVVSAMATGAEPTQTMRLIVSLSDDLSSPVYVSDYSEATDIFDQVEDVQNVWKFAVTGLDPATLYFYNVELAGVAIDTRDTSSLTTCPAEGAGADIRIAIISCNKTNAKYSQVHTFLANLDPRPLLLIHLGDFGYPEFSEPDIALQLTYGLPASLRDASIRQFNRYVPTMYLPQDHDYSLNEGNDTVFGDDADSVAKHRAIVADSLAIYQAMVPHYPLRNGGAHTYAQSATIGRVRIIGVDTQSQSRFGNRDIEPFPIADPYVIGSTQPNVFWNQLADIQAQLAAAEADSNVDVILLLVPMGWHGLKVSGFFYYAPLEKTALEDWIAANMTKLVLLPNGDFHAQAIDDGTVTDTSTGGAAAGKIIPILCSGALVGADEKDWGYTFAGRPAFFGGNNRGACILDVAADASWTVTFVGEPYDGATPTELGVFASSELPP